MSELEKKIEELLILARFCGKKKAEYTNKLQVWRHEGKFHTDPPCKPCRWTVLKKLYSTQNYYLRKEIAHLEGRNYGKAVAVSGVERMSGRPPVSRFERPMQVLSKSGPR